MKTPWSTLKLVILTVICLDIITHEIIHSDEILSKTIRDVIKEPLPSEDLSYTESEKIITIQGPTFKYSLDKSTGTITEIEVLRNENTVIKGISPLNVVIDNEKSSHDFSGKTQIDYSSNNIIITITEGMWKSGLPSTIKTTFYSDGVVVSQYTLKPNSDVILSQGIRQDITIKGIFSHYLHKRRDTCGLDCYQGPIPEVGKTTRLYTPTSCLEVYSNECAFAIFTDMGDYYRSSLELDTSAVSTNSIEKNKFVQLSLHQHLIHIGEKDQKYILRKEVPFTFRIGIATAPNRLPHPRRNDLRMFIWIGDQNYPYPSNQEIQTVAKMGFTLFQMHRLGPPGIPRPPEKELNRVINTVHDAGMLFIWTENADLLYAHDPEVINKMNNGKWIEWEGFNYGGRYKATMDPFCDLVATCLASPNNLADYRIASIKKMLEKYPIDGMYIDDNLAYPNCKHWQEHNHPQKIYDCLIELHELNWRRREALKEKIPHLVLIDHCSHAFVLPVIAPFDAHLFGEGYDFNSVEEFKATFASFSNMYAHGFLYAGDDEEKRCPVESAYIFDLLTGGGQYCTIDWRIWYNKFPYAQGVSPSETEKITNYNLIQYNFGMYESSPPIELPTSVSNTYTVLYTNNVWNDYLLIVANKTKSDQTITISNLDQKLNRVYPYFAVLDALNKKLTSPPLENLSTIFKNLPLKPEEIKIYYIRNIPSDIPSHLWGGKRISEHWDDKNKILKIKLDAPPHSEENILILKNKSTIKKLTINDIHTVGTDYQDDGIISLKTLYSPPPATIKIYTSNEYH